MPHLKRLVLVVVTALAVTFGGQVTPALAANPYERGPAPTDASIEAARGSFAIAQTIVARTGVSGFGGGTIYYPTSTSAGHLRRGRHLARLHRYESSIAWLGPRLASQGFVVITIDTNYHPGPARQPRPAAAGRAGLPDPAPARCAPGSTRTRLGVMGHSMGGGGTLEAAEHRPTLQAADPADRRGTPTKTWSGVRVPTLIIGARERHRRPVGVARRAVLHQPAGRLDKAYLELNSAIHFAPNISQHDDREVQHLVAQAVRRQRHPLRAVPVPAADRVRDLGVPRHLPALRLSSAAVRQYMDKDHRSERRPAGRGETFPAGSSAVHTRKPAGGHPHSRPGGPSTPENRPAAVHTQRPAPADIRRGRSCARDSGVGDGRVTERRVRA